MSIAPPDYGEVGPDRLNLGDTRDDDATILDRLVESHAEPPTAEKLPFAVPEPLHRPRPLTRLITGSIDLQPGWSPMQLLPADPDRESLVISAYSYAQTPGIEHVLISDDAAKVSSIGGAFILYHGQGTDKSLSHTGPVWVYGIDLGWYMRVTYMAVTK
jgi:hypothetical protein